MSADKVATGKYNGASEFRPSVGLLYAEVVLFLKLLHMENTEEKYFYHKRSYFLYFQVGLGVGLSAFVVGGGVGVLAQ